MKLDWKKRFGVYGAVAFLGIAVATVATPGIAQAAPTTVTSQCIENGSAFFTQSFGFDLNAAASTPDGTAFTVTMNPTAITLPSTTSDGSTTVSTYQDLLLQVQVQGGSFVDSSIQQVAGATDNGGAVAETGSTSGDTASFSIPGPIDPGQLNTSQWTVDVLPDGTSSSVTFIGVGWSATANTPGGALADTCSLPSDTLLSVGVDAPTTTTAPPTTMGPTTVPGGPATTVPVAQTKIHGSSTASNNCSTTLNPPLQKPSTHQGDPITLSNTKLTVKVPAALLQLGVDTNLIKNGDKVPSTVDLVVSGSSTTQKTHAYKVSGTANIVVVGGKAQPLTATLALPNTTWTPLNATDPVFFTEKSMTIVSSLTLPSIGLVTVTFGCTPSSAPSFVALAAQGTALPSAGGGSVGSAGGGVSASATTGSQLPRTGGNSMVLIAIGLVSIELGLLAWRMSKRLRLEC